MTKGKSETKRNRNRHRAGSDSKHDRAGLKGKPSRPKKDGGGGSYTWGRPGDEAALAPDLQKGDPNYDSQAEDDGVVFSTDERYDSQRNGNENGGGTPAHDFNYLNYAAEGLHAPKVSLKAFKLAVTKTTQEYFVSEDAREFLRQIEELDSNLLHYDLVKRMITLSMEKTDRERELVSKMLILLQTQRKLPQSQVGKAFEKLFENVDDLKLDIPNVRKYLAQFLARCVADEVLPPIFLASPYVEKLAGNIVEHAKTLLSIKHGLVRLERVWGLNFDSPIDELKMEIKMILQEYLTSDDLEEALSLVQRLKIPFFHHEIIKRGVILAMENKEREQAKISVLIKQLYKNEVISEQQIILGFQRLYQELHDIKLDNPDAETVLEIFARQAVEDGCMTSEELRSLKKRAEVIAKEERESLDLQYGYGRDRAQSMPH